MRIEIECDVPEGFEATGEFRKAEIGELVLLSSGLSWRVDGHRSYAYVILREKRREPRPGEVWGSRTGCAYLITSADGTPLSGNSCFVCLETGALWGISYDGLSFLAASVEEWARKQRAASEAEAFAAGVRATGEVQRSASEPCTRNRCDDATHVHAGPERVHTPATVAAAEYADTEMHPLDDRSRSRAAESLGWAIAHAQSALDTISPAHSVKRDGLKG